MSNVASWFLCLRIEWGQMIRRRFRTNSGRGSLASIHDHRNTFWKDQTTILHTVCGGSRSSKRCCGPVAQGLLVERDDEGDYLFAKCHIPCLVSITIVCRHDSSVKLRLKCAPFGTEPSHSDIYRGCRRVWCCLQ